MISSGVHFRVHACNWQLKIEGCHSEKEWRVESWHLDSEWEWEVQDSRRQEVIPNLLHDAWNPDIVEPSLSPWVINDLICRSHFRVLFCMWQLKIEGCHSEKEWRVDILTLRQRVRVRGTRRKCGIWVYKCRTLATDCHSEKIAPTRATTSGFLTKSVSAHIFSCILTWYFLLLLSLIFGIYKSASGIGCWIS